MAEFVFFCMSLLLLLLVLIFLFLKALFFGKNSSNLPKTYPILGSYFEIVKNADRFPQWTAEIVNSAPSRTFVLDMPAGHRRVITANAANVRHVLKTHFDCYEKGFFIRSHLRDLLGDGILNADGGAWRMQRRIAAHFFTEKLLRKFADTVVDGEIDGRLMPLLKTAAVRKAAVDLEHVLRRFALDNICNVAFGYDPEYLSTPLPDGKLISDFDTAARLTMERFNSLIPFFWKIKKLLNVGSEKRLKTAVTHIKSTAQKIIRHKRRQIEASAAAADDDLLTQFLNSSGNPPEFVTDAVTNFLLAGVDTVSATLTWLFWLISKHPETERNILDEIHRCDDPKKFVYTQAAICETMRLFPPVPTNTKIATADVVLPDGNRVKKGWAVTYHVYAMGRSEELWGEDSGEFRPERWLEKAAGGEGWSFVNRDSCSFPVFQAGRRMCLGKEMAFMEMKRVVAAVLRDFRVVPALEDGAEPVYVAYLTAKMMGGFPVTIHPRD